MTGVVRSGVGGPAGPTTSGPDADDFVSACVILVLDQRPATAQQLSTHLRTLGLTESGIEPAWIGPLLRGLVTEGLVDDDEHDGDGGGRIYSLTPEGTERLGIAADSLRSTQILLRRFLARCGERSIATS